MTTNEFILGWSLILILIFNIICWSIRASRYYQYCKIIDKTVDKLDGVILYYYLVVNYKDKITKLPVSKEVYEIQQVGKNFVILR
jgi:hypothetical protein